MNRTRTSLWLVVSLSVSELRAGGLAMSKTEDPLSANEQDVSPPPFINFYNLVVNKSKLYKYNL